MHYFSAFPITLLLLLIPNTLGQQLVRNPHNFYPLDTYHSPHLPASLFRRAAQPPIDGRTLTIRYHHAENTALRDLRRAEAIARTPQAHVRAAEIRTFAAIAYEHGRVAEHYREVLLRQNPAAADEGHLRALHWIEVFILQPAYVLYQRFQR